MSYNQHCGQRHVRVAWDSIWSSYCGPNWLGSKLKVPCPFGLPVKLTVALKKSTAKEELVA